MTVPLLILAVIVALVMDRLHSKDPFRGISHELKISSKLVEPGEKFKVVTEITNTRKLPILFLKVSENLPLKIEVEESPGVKFYERQYMSDTKVITAEQTMYIMPGEKAVRTINASVPARGRYVFTGGQLRAGDLLGFDDMTMSLNKVRDLVALPKKIECADVDTAFGNFLGDISVRRFILSDPILTVGFREYTGREPQKDISWPRSLRDGKLMVKQYDYTSEMTATVMLNVAGASPADMERAFCLARHICEELEEKRISYSFITNACCSNSAGLWSYIGDGLGSGHLMAILEGLGRAGYDCMFSFERLLEKASRHPDSGRAFILVTPVLDANGTRALAGAESRMGNRFLKVEAVQSAEGASSEEAENKTVKEAAA